jgi:hypothetical protein
VGVYDCSREVAEGNSASCLSIVTASCHVLNPIACALQQDTHRLYLYESLHLVSAVARL